MDAWAVSYTHLDVYKRQDDRRNTVAGTAAQNDPRTVNGGKTTMDYLKILHENPDLADEFDSLFDFFLLDELFPRNDAEGRCTFSLPGMAFARDGSGGEYHLSLIHI